MSAERVLRRSAAHRAEEGVAAALRERNFRLFFIGNLFSSCGTWFQNIAQTLLVYRLTGSVFLVGVVNLAQFAGVLVLAPSAGVAADRIDRRKLMLATQVASAVVTATLAMLSFAGLASVPIVVIAALILGVAQTYSTPTMLSLVPELVPEGNLTAAVALNIVTFNVARTVGPVLGALVVTLFGISTAFALNSLSFIGFSVALMVIRTRAQPRPATTERPRLRDTARALRRRPATARLYVVAICASIAIDPVTTLSPAFATDIFERSDTLVGWMVGAFGLGAVAAGVVVSQQRPPSDAALRLRLVLMTLGMTVFALSGSLVVSMVALVVAGYGFIALCASALTRIQRDSASSELGRMMALWTLAFMGSRPIASLLDGGLATVIGVRATTLIVVAPSIGAMLMLGGRPRTNAAGEAGVAVPGV